eukprot:m.131595 g.131595  ORF g.131595 m.131595 type:complete len:85 (-) comp13075_c6_seq4:37-291(-)
MFVYCAIETVVSCPGDFFGKTAKTKKKKRTQLRRDDRNLKKNFISVYDVTEALQDIPQIRPSKLLTRAVAINHMKKSVLGRGAL